MSKVANTNLMLMVTTACNLSCSYCYEGHEGQTRPDGVMSMETAMSALHMAAAGGRPFHVQITGGEPLLVRERVFDILDQIERNKWPVAVSLQTNGVLLDRSTARQLKRRRVGVGISLDGSPRVQEMLRGGSSGTYRALKLLEEEQIPFRVTTVLTNRNISELGGLLMALHRFSSACGIGFDLLVQKGVAVNGDCKLPDEAVLRKELFRVLVLLDLLNLKRGRPLELREKKHVFRSLRTGGVSPFCAACVGRSLAVTPEGKLYPCTQAAGDPSLDLGTLDKPLSGSCSLSEIKLATDRCNRCPLEGRCPGECPSRLLYNGDAGRKLVCALYQTIYEYGFQKGEIEQYE